MDASLGARPLVSTITPYYRGEKYLAGFLENVSAQTWFDRLEIVLDHNDPSDSELQVVRDFQRSYPGRLRHQIVSPVVPIGESMNRCISSAFGQFLTIWNIDDLRPPEAIEAQARVLERDTDVDIVYTDFVVVERFGETVGTPYTGGAPERELTRGMVLGPNFMFRASLLDRAGKFDEQYRQGADYDLAIRLCLNGRAKHLPEVGCFYLDEGLGLTSRPGSVHPQERTVTELRYGVYDRIDYSLLPGIVHYDISMITFDGVRHAVSDFVPGYEDLLRERAEEDLQRGLWYAAVRMSPVRPAARFARSVARRMGLGT